MVSIPDAPVDIELKYSDYSLVYINGVPVYTFFVKCIDYNALPTEANVRATSDSAPYKSMIETLVDEPGMFFFKNGGINVISTGFKDLDSLIDLNKPGITVMTGIGDADTLSRRYC